MDHKTFVQQKWTTKEKRLRITVLDNSLPVQMEMVMITLRPNSKLACKVQKETEISFCYQIGYS